MTKTPVNKYKPAISREVINDPVYTLSTANPCSNCNLGTAFPDAIINSDRGVAPNLAPKGGKVEGGDKKQQQPQKQELHLCWPSSFYIVHK